MLEQWQCKEELSWIKFLTVNISIMNKIKIQQTRSRIGRPKDQKRTLDALGLRKMHQIVEHNLTPQIDGMINKIKHLITIVE
jgi:large subunit ribosomal protein L30